MSTPIRTVKVVYDRAEKYRGIPASFRTKIKYFRGRGRPAGRPSPSMCRIYWFLPRPRPPGSRRFSVL